MAVTKEKTNMADFIMEIMVVLIIAFFSVSGIVYVFGMQAGIIISVEKYNQALNTIAELKCPMMQYENWDGTFACNGEYLYNGTIWHSECIKNVIYKNFTTGFYNATSGNITCMSEPYFVENKVIFPNQNFTLEEFGIR